jgi:hypothetical protein
MPLPEKGTYFAELMSAIVSEGKSCPQFVLSLSITHISKNGTWKALPGSFLRHVYIYLSDKSWETSQKKLESLGFNGDFCNPDFSDKIKNEGVELTCTHQQYEGEWRDKWELANWGGTEVKRASSDIVRQLQAKWKAKAGAKPAAPKSNPPPPPQDDDPSDADAPWIEVNEPGAQG